ncbi:hypothetical protein P692DRAFT_20955133, partial [Suillus brevipes Sb2]
RPVGYFFQAVDYFLQAVNNFFGLRSIQPLVILLRCHSNDPDAANQSFRSINPT